MPAWPRLQAERTRGRKAAKVTGRDLSISNPARLSFARNAAGSLAADQHGIA